MPYLREDKIVPEKRQIDLVQYAAGGPTKKLTSVGPIPLTTRRRARGPRRALSPSFPSHSDALDRPSELGSLPFLLSPCRSSPASLRRARCSPCPRAGGAPACGAGQMRREREQGGGGCFSAPPPRGPWPRRCRRRRMTRRWPRRWRRGTRWAARAGCSRECPRRWGATAPHGGVNFAVYSSGASAASLCLFTPDDLKAVSFPPLFAECNFCNACCDPSGFGFMAYSAAVREFVWLHRLLRC